MSRKTIETVTLRDGSVIAFECDEDELRKMFQGADPEIGEQCVREEYEDWLAKYKETK